MNTLTLLGTALGLAACAGINLYATVAITGIAIRLAWVTLPDGMGGLEALADWWIIGVAGGMYIVEFVADKWPWLDNIWDTVHTFIRPPAAALVALAATAETSNIVIEVIAVLLAGGIALGTHSAKATTRVAMNAASPHEPFKNIAMSLGEDAVVAGSVFFVMAHPLVTIVILCAVTILAIWLAPKFMRLIGVQFRSMACTLRYWRRGRTPMEYAPPPERYRGDLPYDSILVTLPCASVKMKKMERNRHGYLVVTQRKEIAFVTRRWFKPARRVFTSVEVERIDLKIGWMRRLVTLQTTLGPAVFALYRDRPEHLEAKVGEMRRILGVRASEGAGAGAAGSDAGSSGRKLAAAVSIAAVALLASCGDDIAMSGQTIAAVSLVRPDVTVAQDDAKARVFEDMRILPGAEVSVGGGGRAILVLDSGIRAVVDGGSGIGVEGMGTVRLDRGRIWVDAGAGEVVEVGLGKAGKLKVATCSTSISMQEGRLEAYVASGELTYVLAGGSGTAREGERLVLAGGKAEVEPSDLWDDWTGGLAEAGPRPMETPTGVGAIFARRPGSPGVERFSLVIRRQEVKVRIEGDLAITETVQEFFNPASEVLEGVYRLRVPEDAILQRFAVDRDGTLVEGSVIERRLASQTYEQQVYAGSPHDPAILEWMAPGSFKARIYPIQPGAVRTIAYSYTQWLRPAGDDGRRRVWVFPMGNETLAPTIGEFLLTATLEDAGTAAVRAGLGARVDQGKVVFSASDFQPRSDFTLELIDVESELEEDEVRLVTSEYEPLTTSSAYQRATGKQSAEKEKYFFTQFSLRPEKVSIEPVERLRLAVVLDLSAATDQELADLGTTIVDDLLRQLGPEDRMAVLAGDLKVDLMGGAKDAAAAAASEDLKEAAIEALGRRPTGGATDIGEIVAGAAAQVGKEPGGVVVYVGDGFPTVGEMDLESLRERMGRLPHQVRLFGVALGDESNLDLLDGLSRPGGFAGRVSNRIEAAEMAYRILAEASVPVFEDVRYEIDGGVERLYPRGSLTIRVDRPLRIIGRLTGEKDPEAISVKGTYGGKPFEVRLVPVIEEIEDHDDLRLRWATERLHGLMEEGAGREAVVELGNRYHLVTPFNSILVPSSATNMDVEREKAGSWGQPVAAAPVAEEYAAPKVAMEAIGHGAGDGSGVGYGTGYGKTAGTASTGTVKPGAAIVNGALSKEVIRRIVNQRRGMIASCYQAGLALNPSLGGSVTIKFVIDSTGAVTSAAVASSTLGDSDVEQCIAGVFKKMTFPYPEGGGTVIVSYPLTLAPPSGAPWGGGVVAAAVPQLTSTTSTSFSFSTTTTTTMSADFDPKNPGGLSANQKACMLSSLIPLEERIALWQERIGTYATPDQAMQVWWEAVKRCEVKTMQDRRALARVLLTAVQGIPGRCSLVKSMKSQPAVADYIRSKILVSVKTPDQIRQVMEYCDGAVAIGPDEVKKIIEKAKTPADRIKALKELIAIYPLDLDLELKLLDALEDEGSPERLAEAMRLAQDLRHAPYAGDVVRTRVGEFYIRHDMRDEARRCFSEIVEFSPFAPAARRRLGDLYRNYGWHEDAYRQYETLQAMVPEDESVLVLMAEAAAMAGRVDEALRLTERVSQSAAGSATTSELALIFNAIRLAALRDSAKAAGDEAKLQELIKRSRRAGVLRDASDLRVVLRWDHPDVRMKLFAKFTGSEVERASFVVPHFGCEAFAEKESSGDVIVQIVRDPASVQKETRGTLTIIWHEGQADESIETFVVEIKKDAKDLAFTLSQGKKAVPAKPVKVDPMSLAQP